jgi:hypothetical protein
MADNVKSPAHYTAGGIETIDFIAAKLGPAGFRAYCVGNAVKYLSRWDKKNGTEDLAKAEVYIGWALRGRTPQGIVPHALAAKMPQPPSTAFDPPERAEVIAQAVHDAIEGEVGLVPGCPGGVCGVAE